MLSVELLRQFEAVVCRWYAIARESILFYETEEGRKATEAITEVRDALDHFYLATTMESEDEARHLLRLAEDHLRSAAVEPLERAIEERLHRAMQVRDQWMGKRRLVVYFLGLQPPPVAEVTEAESRVKGHLRTARELKGNGGTADQAVAQFKEAYRAAQRLEQLFQPHEVNNRLFSFRANLLAGMIFFVLVILATIALTFLLG